jgi:hypothetical protein
VIARQGEDEQPGHSLADLAGEAVDTGGPLLADRIQRSAVAEQ